jgi:hypothetical protein
MDSAGLIDGSINVKERFDFPRICVQEPNTAFDHTKTAFLA